MSLHTIPLGMEPTMRFRVLIEEDVKKLAFKNGMPLTVEELVAAVKEAFSITVNISLQFKDEDFGEFFPLTSPNELREKATLHIVYPVVNLFIKVVSQESTPNASDVSSLCEPSKRQNPWPQVFPIPTFSHNTELALRQGNDIFLRESRPVVSPSVKSDILECLAEAMFSYTGYPIDAQRSALAQALVGQYPWLKEPG